MRLTYFNEASSSSSEAVAEEDDEGCCCCGAGEVAGLCEIEIRAPQSDYSDRIQEIHIKVIHILVMLIEQEVKQ